MSSALTWLWTSRGITRLKLNETLINPLLGVKPDHITFYLISQTILPSIWSRSRYNGLQHHKLVDQPGMNQITKLHYSVIKAQYSSINLNCLEVLNCVNEITALIGVNAKRFLILLNTKAHRTFLHSKLDFNTTFFSTQCLLHELPKSNSPLWQLWPLNPRGHKHI